MYNLKKLYSIKYINIVEKCTREGKSKACFYNVTRKIENKVGFRATTCLVPNGYFAQQKGSLFMETKSYKYL